MRDIKYKEMDMRACSEAQEYNVDVLIQRRRFCCFWRFHNFTDALEFFCDEDSPWVDMCVAAGEERETLKVLIAFQWIEGKPNMIPASEIQMKEL